MTLLKTVDARFADSPNIDAFGRLRSSNLTTMGDVKLHFDNAPLLINQVQNGTGLSTYNTGLTKYTNKEQTN